MAGEIKETHRALTELLAPGVGLHSAPDILRTYFDDAAIVRTAHVYLARQTGVTQDGRAVVVSAGLPAAGKSTVLNRLHLSGYRLIDPDAAKDLLLHDAEVHGLLDYRSGISLPDGGPVKLRELFAHGYAGVDVVDVELPLDAALKRARQRWWDGRKRSPEGGRFVPEDAVRACYGENPDESLSAANAMRLAQDAAEGLGHGSLHRFEMDPSTQAPVQTQYTVFGS